MKALDDLKDNLREEIEAHPTYPDLANMMGLLLTLQGQHAEAVKEFERALGINPRYYECAANRAFAAGLLDDDEKAVQDARELAQTAPEDYQALVTCAKLLTWKGNAEEARSLLEKAVSLKPQCPATCHYIGLTFLPDATQKAVENFEKAASLGSAYIALYDSLHVYRKGKIKLSKQASSALLNQLSENPNTVKVYLSTANMLASSGKFDEAAALFEKARAIEPDSPAIENSLGLIATAREYGEEAKLHFRRALQFDPRDINSRVNLAFQLGAEGDVSGAEEEMRKAVEVAPRYPDLRLQLAAILTEREELDEAITHLQQALSINPRYVFAAFVLASIHFTKRRYKEVIDTYAQMDIGSIGLPEVYSHLATSFLELNQADKALDMANSAIASENALPSIYVCQAIAYHRLNRIGDALESAREYVRLYPDGPEIEEINKLLSLLQESPDNGKATQSK